jgi:hypothetical protein
MFLNFRLYPLNLMFLMNRFRLMNHLSLIRPKNRLNLMFLMNRFRLMSPMCPRFRLYLLSLMFLNFRLYLKNLMSLMNRLNLIHPKSHLTL